MRNIAIAAGLLTCLAMPAAAGAGSNMSSMSFRIQGFVPVICRVQMTTIPTMPDAEGIARLGVADEFCNAPRGYRVVVQHAQNLEGAAMIDNGVRIPLSSSGVTVLTDADRPDLRRAQLSVDLGETPDRFDSLRLRIEAKS